MKGRDCIDYGCYAGGLLFFNFSFTFSQVVSAFHLASSWQRNMMLLEEVRLPTIYCKLLYFVVENGQNDVLLTITVAVLTNLSDQHRQWHFISLPEQWRKLFHLLYHRCLLCSWFPVSVYLSSPDFFSLLSTTASSVILQFFSSVQNCCYFQVKFHFQYRIDSKPYLFILRDYMDFHAYS